MSGLRGRHAAAQVALDVFDDEPLRIDKRNFAANGCWRKHYAGNHEGKRHTDESKNKAVAPSRE
jgi:hypothetical protein